MQTLLDYPTPQAHSPHLIVGTVKAVAEGVTTNEAIAERLKLSERGCAYYTNAAGTLGYLRHGWALTEDGETFYLLSPSEQVTDLCRRMSGVIEAMAATDWEGGKAASTVEYREAAIRAWAHFISLPLREQVVGLSEPITQHDSLGGQRAAGGPPHKMCEKCGMQIAYAVTECEWC